MSSYENACFVPWCLLFEDMFDYDLTLVKCEERSGLGGSTLFQLFFSCGKLRRHISKDQQRLLFKNVN